MKGKIVGSSDICFMSGIKTSHRAVLGITIQKKYWNLGIGSAMFEKLIKTAEENEKRLDEILPVLYNRKVKM